jgi:branched-subunit amino acid aminotransferase/4-amino-4-deoxychorismate lyase
MAELNAAPVDPRALEALALVNYGHFTSMRVDDHQVRGLTHHLQRLINDCRTLFDVDLDADHVRGLIRREVDSTPGSYVLRVTVFDPDMSLGVPAAADRPSVLVTTRPAGSWPAEPFRVRTATYNRERPTVKHVGLFGAVALRRAAQKAGYDDCLFLDDASFVSEGATWNVGFLDGSKIVWPNAEVLPGVTMRLLQQVHEQSVSAPVHLRDIPNMHAAFATNTSVGVRPIASVDGVKLAADHAMLRTLLKEYEEIPGERP